MAGSRQSSQKAFSLARLAILPFKQDNFEQDEKFSDAKELSLDDIEKLMDELACLAVLQQDNFEQDEKFSDAKELSLDDVEKLMDDKDDGCSEQSIGA